MIQEKGTFVKIRYRLRTGDGDYVKGDPDEGYAHLEFFTGYNQVIPGLETRLIGRKVAEKIKLRLPQEEGFGPYRDDLVKEKNYEEFPEGRDLQEGRYAVARDETTRTAYGYFVKQKEENRIILDFNHPLAGKALIYDLEILEVRPATDEEKGLLRPCEGAEEPT